MAVGLADPEIYQASGWNMFRYFGGPQESGLGNPVRGKIEKDPEPGSRPLVPGVLYLEMPTNSLTVTAGMKTLEDTRQVWTVDNRSGTWGRRCPAGKLDEICAVSYLAHPIPDVHVPCHTP